MPIFDLKCTSCSFAEERIIKLDQANPPCRQCGGETERLKPSQFGFAISGGGCYKPGLSTPRRKPT